jgi:hypothetical protein
MKLVELLLSINAFRVVELVDKTDSEGKVIQEENEVPEHCRLYFDRLLNEGFIENILFMLTHILARPD